jgi:hypothetical protein
MLKRTLMIIFYFHFAVKDLKRRYFKAIVGVPQLASRAQAARAVCLHPNNYKHEAHT